MNRADLAQIVRMETRQRSFVKAGLWTVIGLVMMTLTGYLATGSVGTGGGLALANAAIGMACYLVYDRIWARISWGRHAG